jgi:hypothetical protein
MKTTNSTPGHDIHLNIGLGESIVRGLIAIFLPWPLIAIAPVLLIAGVPVAAYLLTTALTHFCIFRYIWQHEITHRIVEDPWDQMNDEH